MNVDIGYPLRHQGIFRIGILCHVQIFRIGDEASLLGEEGVVGKNATGSTKGKDDDKDEGGDKLVHDTIL